MAGSGKQEPIQQFHTQEGNPEMAAPRKKTLAPSELDLAKVRERTSPHDAAHYLQTEEHMTAYLEAAMESGDLRLVSVALDTIARAKGMVASARECFGRAMT
jgi:hypothetical protein